MKGGRRPGAGRPKGSRTKATRDIRELAQQYTADAISTLQSIMLKGQNESARIAAAKELLDRGYGKAAQTVHATVDSTTMVVEAPKPAATPQDWIASHGPH